MTPLLLDTCAAIWMAEDEPIGPNAAEAIDRAATDRVPIFISPMTAWEVGLLNARGRLVMSMSPLAWFEALLSVPGIELAEVTAKILVASSFLPGNPPRDPADKIIAATARENGYQLITRDGALLGYAEQGHIQTLAC